MKKENAAMAGFDKKRKLTVVAALLLTATAVSIKLAPGISSGPTEAVAPIMSDNTPSVVRTQLREQAKSDRQQRRAEVAAVDDESTELLIEPMVVQSLLYEIEFDEDGNVVVDDEARRLLEKSIFLLGQSQGQLSLDLLDQMIRAGLPGSEGEQVADIFRRYYEYKSAEGELIAAAEVDGEGAAGEVLDRLVQLRQGYLGYELTRKLFAEEEAYMRNTLMLMEEAEAEAAGKP